MRKTELVFGAVVAVKGNEALRLKVNGITKKKIQYINSKKQPEYLRHSELVPVQLNDRMLEDLGFKKRSLKYGNNGSVVVNDFILYLFDKKDENIFYKITTQFDDELGINKYRAIHIDDNRSENVGFGYVRDVHELQALILSTTKMCLNTEKLFKDVEMD